MTRIEYQKFDHPGHVVGARREVPLLPIYDTHFVATDDFCRGYLADAKVEAAFPNLPTQCA